MVGRDSALQATSHELACVVGIAAANNHHGIDAVEQLLKRLLMILGGMTNGVNKANLGMRIFFSDGSSKHGRVTYLSSGLAHNSQAVLRVAAHIFEFLNHIKAG